MGLLHCDLKENPHVMCVFLKVLQFHADGRGAKAFIMRSSKRSGISILGMHYLNHWLGYVCAFDWHRVLRCLE